MRTHSVIRTLRAKPKPPIEVILNYVIKTILKFKIVENIKLHNKLKNKLGFI